MNFTKIQNVLYNRIGDAKISGLGVPIFKKDIPNYAEFHSDHRLGNLILQNRKFFFGRKSE